MTGPREWRHAEGCGWIKLGGREFGPPCNCGLSAVRDATAAGHRVVVGPEGVEGRLDSHISRTKAGYVVVPLEEKP